MLSGAKVAGELELLMALREIEKSSPGATAKFAAIFAALKSISNSKLTGGLCLK